MSESALILLSTYNGEKYLREQLDSIIAQTFKDWTLLIRDDGSTDSTIEIIQEYRLTDSRICFVIDNQGNLNTKLSFSRLMGYALTKQQSYILFCDQDDVWLPEKVAKTVSMLQLLEKQNSSQTPILVHSDLCVVDSNLNTIHPSYLRHERLNRNTMQPLKTLLINNYVTGCTVGINRALLQMATPVPDAAFMHDWWCALCAATAGKIGFIDEATIMYRQHSQNSIGSKGLTGKLTELMQLKKSLSRRITNLRACFQQANILREKIDDSHEQYPLLEKFTSIPTHPVRLRYASTQQMQLAPASRLRRLAFWMLLGFV